MKTTLLVITMLLLPSLLAAIPAFPGAEGWGANSRGGRSGAVINNQSYDTRVIHVTNLLASGTGSLASALSIGGPRVIVFDVSGVIDLKQSNIFISSFCTVAGQTSPGGITIVNGGIFARPTTRTNLFEENWSSNQDIIMRHIRSRSSRWHGGDDNLRLEYCHDVIIDHCSFGNCCDEIMDVMYSYNMTYSWCIISESNIECGGETHRHGIIATVTTKQSSLHNFWAHHDSRVPKFTMCVGSDNCSPVTSGYEVINNVIYNCDPSQTFNQNYSHTPFYNLLGNYLKSGPNYQYTTSRPQAWYASGSETIYAEGNFNPGLTSLPQTAFVSGGPNWSNTIMQPLNVASYTTGQQTVQDVITKVGPFPRDSCDSRLIREMQTGTGQWRVLTSQERSTQTLIPRDPLVLPNFQKPVDADYDGMADVWELRNGLNPNDNTDFKTPMNNGYDAIEVYINELSDTLVATGRWPAYLTSIEDNDINRQNLQVLVHPNPFNSGTNIQLQRGQKTEDRGQKIKINIFNVNGKLIDVLSSDLWSLSSGVSWDASHLPSGIYLAKLRFGNKIITKKLFYIR